MKRFNLLLTGVIALLLASPSLLNAGELKPSKDDEDAKEPKVVCGLTLPDKQPKLDERIVESYRKYKKYADFFKLHDDLLHCYIERKALQTPAEDPKEARKNAKELEKVEKKLNKAKRKFFKVAKKLRTPIDREYNKLRDKYDQLDQQADEALDKGNERKAEKLSQASAKFTGKMEELKTNIDLINMFLFFDEYEKDDDTTGKLPVNNNDDDNDKIQKSKKPKKSKKDKKD